MLCHSAISDQQLFHLLRRRSVCYAGNRRLKIYGRLACASGRRMGRERRVFFASEAEALAAGYRPCARCLPQAYRDWKAGHTRGS